VLEDSTDGGTTISLDALLPVDVPARVAQGYPLSASRATLSRWIEGTAREDARVVLAGVVRDPQFGAAHEAVSLTIEASPWVDSVLVPPAGLLVTGANWDGAMILSLATDERGLQYPVVVGVPGRVSSLVAGDQWITGSQGVWVDHRNINALGHQAELTLVLAGHHVAAESVMANTSTFPEGLRFQVVNGHDLSGNPIAYLSWWRTRGVVDDPFNYDAAGTYTWDYDATSATPSSLGHASVDPSFQPNDGESSPVFVGWYDNDDPYRGGLVVNGESIRGAGDVLEWLLGLTSRPIDRGQFAAAAPILNRYKLDFTIDARVKPWDFVAANLLPVLPVSVVDGPLGISIIAWDFAATAADAVLVLDADADPSLARSGKLREDRRNLANDITVRYALSIRTGAYQGSIRLAASREIGGGDGEVIAVYPSAFCRQSQTQFRGPDGRPLVAELEIETAVIYEDATALLLASTQARVRALPQHRVKYSGPESRYGHAKRGQVAVLTDGEIAFVGRVAHVLDVVTDAATVTIELLLLQDPVRDLYPAS
jgi:hypothetical protein